MGCIASVEVGRSDQTVWSAQHRPIHRISKTSTYAGAHRWAFAISGGRLNSLGDKTVLCWSLWLHREGTGSNVSRFVG